MAAYTLSITQYRNTRFLTGLMNVIRNLFASDDPTSGETVSEPAASGDALSEPETSLDSAKETSPEDPKTDRTIPKTDTETDRTIVKT